MNNLKLINARAPRFCSLSKNNVLKWEDWNGENLEFINYYTYYTNIALNNFKWIISDIKKYPLITSDFIEKLLFYKGCCAVINHPDRGYMLCTFATIDGYYNYFGYPTKITAYDVFDGLTPLGNYDYNDFVIIPNNILFYPTNNIVIEKAMKLATIQEAIDINIDGQKIPVVFQGETEQKQTLQIVMKKYYQGERPLFLNKEFKTADVTCLNPEVPFKVPELYKAGDTVKSELLTMLGINNVNISKESGVTDSEVNSNNQVVNLSFDIFKNARLKAIDELKEKFGIEAQLEILTKNKDLFNIKVENSVESGEN